MSGGFYIGERSRRPVIIGEGGEAQEPFGPYGEKLLNGKRYRQQVEREGQVVPAEPGWYAVIAFAFADSKEEIERWPVVAWEAADFGAYVITYMTDTFPVSRLTSEVEMYQNAVLVGLRHPVHAPEDDAFLEDARRMLADEGIPVR